MMRPPLSEQEKNLLVRRMFLCGSICLPLLHVVSYAFFRDKLRSGDLSQETSKWVTLSFTSAVISTTLCILWVVIFQTSWTTWPWATTIMVSVPDSDMTGW